MDRPVPVANQLAASEAAAAVYADQVALLYRHSSLVIAANLLTSALLAAVHWSTVPAGPLLGWLAVMWTITAARGVLAQRYGLAQPSPDQARRWGQWFIFLVSLSGFCWGAGAVLLFPLQTLEQRVFTMLVLAGMSAGSVPILVAVKLAAVGHLVAITVPVASAFAYQGTGLSVILAPMMLIFLGGMIITASIAHRSVTQSLHLRRENKQAELEARVKERTAELEQLANHDPLTQLPNRLLLRDRLEHALRNVKRSGVQLAVLFLDLDRFKLINDSLGHDAGDKLLQEVASRLQGCLRESDTIARLGGDEFVIILEGPAVNGQAMAVARRVMAILATPITIRERTVVVSASIGISYYPQDGNDIKALLRRADNALQQVKQQGRNDVRCFSA